MVDDETKILGHSPPNDISSSGFADLRKWGKLRYHNLPIVGASTIHNQLFIKLISMLPCIYWDSTNSTAQDMATVLTRIFA